MRNVKIALVQFNSTIGRVDENIQRGRDFIKQAAEKGADLIIFPELYACGYNTIYLENHKSELGFEVKDRHVKLMAEAARENNIYVVMPCIIKEKERLFNGLYIFDRIGKIVGTYKKIHLWEEEAKLFDKGENYKVLDTDFGKIGFLICYDAGFPEAVRMLAMEGAEMVLVCGAFCGLHWKRWNTYYQARALENTIYVGAVNATGGLDNEVWFGNNQFYDMDGNKMMEGLLNIEEMQVVTADLDLVHQSREKGCYLDDLRIDTYQYLNTENKV